MSITSVHIGGTTIDLTTKKSDVSITPIISFVFSQDITSTALASSNKVNFKQGTNDIAFTITQGASSKTIYIQPDNALLLSTDYTLTIAQDLTVKIGDTNYKLASGTILNFTTEAQIPTTPLFKFTQADNSFLTADITATIDTKRKIIWYLLGNGLRETNLLVLTPTVNSLLTKKMKTGDGSFTDFLAPQAYNVAIGGVTEDYRVQVQPLVKATLKRIIDAADINKRIYC